STYLRPVLDASGTVRPVRTGRKRRENGPRALCGFLILGMRGSPCVFKFLLMHRGGEPVEPAAFITAVPNWHEGETLMGGGGKQFRILGINDAINVEGLEELYERGINGIWMVESVDG